MTGTIEALLHGFTIALTWQNLLWALLGVTLGTVVGILPGIGPALTVALLLPVTFNLDPIGSFIMFAGIYYGGMYGGAISSILLNTPGETASIMTAVEGNRMARSGRCPGCGRCWTTRWPKSRASDWCWAWPPTATIGARSHRRTTRTRPTTRAPPRAAPP